VNLSEPFIRRPVATSLMAGALAFLGLAAFPFLPVAPLPQVDFPTVPVTATLAGASAETMASSVATPLERQIGQIAGITQMTSFSALGATSITVQFDLNRNIDLAAQDVQAAITAASKTLPQTMTAPPTYKKFNPADAPILILSAQSDTLPITVVDEYADSFLAQQISQVTGVAQVSLGGEQRPAIRIQVDPAKLGARGLTLEEIRGALLNATTDAPKGSLTSVRTSLTIEANDQIVEPKTFEDVIVAYRNGAPVRVRDIGRAVAAATDRFAAAYHNNAQAILLSVYKQPGANIIDTVEQIKSLLPKLTANISAAMRIDTVLDRTTTIRASVFDVEFTLVLTVALVVLVVLLFLRNLWATLVPAFTIVLSLLGSFAAMYAFNFSIDNLSLMALTIAIGFVVDDAIVEVENVHRHIEKGVAPLEAALTGSNEIRFTVLSISVSLIAVFIPLLLMSGIIGRLFREFALTVTASIVVSAYVSLTLAPMLCARFMRPQSDRHGRLYRTIEAGFDALLSGYRRTLDIVLRHQAVTLGVFFATMTLSVVMMIQIPKGFFPIQDTGMLSGLAEAAQEVSPMEMMRLQRELGAVLMRDPDIAGFASQTGSTGGNGNAQSANTARFFIALKPREERALTASQIIDRLRPQFARVGGPTCSCRPPRTSPSAGGLRAAASNIPYRTPTSPSWSNGRRRCSTRCARCRSLPMPRPISSPSRRVCG
jgi:multidrug efflux pump subunit AcrB